MDEKVIKCLSCGEVFEEYEYVDVPWSGDKLPSCPKCHKNIYESDFTSVQKELA